MTETLEVLREILKEGDTYINWERTTYADDNKFIKVDTLILNVIRCVSEGPDGEIEFLRIPPYYFVDRQTKEPRIVYSLNTCCKVVSGKRKGRIIPLDGVKDHERWTDAGVRASLQACMDTKAAEDAQRVLASFEPQDIPNDLETCLPRLYITIKPCADTAQHLFVRKTGEALKYIRQLPVYDDRRSVQDNLSAVKTEIAVDAGSGRLAYPFEIFYGRGVVAADPSGRGTVGHWIKVTHLSASTGSMEIS
jgi:hypothetical protein